MSRLEMPKLKVMWFDERDKTEKLIVCDFGNIDGLEWRKIKELTGGLTPQAALEAASELDFDALGALVFTFLKRDDSHINMNTVMRGLSIGALIQDEEDEEDVDPTSAED